MLLIRPHQIKADHTRWALCGLLFLVGYLGNIPLAGAIVSLDDLQLDHVTAGQTELSPEPSEGTIPDSGAPPLAPVGGGISLTGNGGNGLVHSNNDANSGVRHQAVVIHQSEATRAHRSTVTLSDHAQARAGAMNLTNASRSDVVHGANIYGGSDISSVSVGAFLIDQRNDSVQLGVPQGRLEFASVGRSSSTNYDRHYAFSDSLQSHVVNRHDDVYTGHIIERQTLNVAVPKYDPFDNLKLELTIPGFDFVIPGWDPPSLIADTIFGEYGVDINIHDTTLKFQDFTLGSLLFTRDDVVYTPIQSIPLPTLDFPQVDLTACFIDCAQVSVDLPDFGGWTIPLPLPEITFAGANPFKDLDLNFGSGFAAAGSGSFRMGGDVQVSLITSFTIEIPDIDTSFEIDILGIPFKSPGIQIPIPDIELEVPLIDEAFPPNNNNAVVLATFTDAVLCMPLAPVDIETCTLSLEKVESVTRINNTLTEAHYENSVFDKYSESMELKIVGGAELLGAEADLIAFGESSIDSESYELVVLDGGSQQEIRVMNSVNAAAAMVGNGMNVSARSRSLRAVELPGADFGLLQMNSFRQIR
jgi:hypothetical protein